MCIFIDFTLLSTDQKMPLVIPEQCRQCQQTGNLSKKMSTESYTVVTLKGMFFIFIYVFLFVFIVFVCFHLS